MAAYDYVVVNVFTDQRFGGNPLAVFPDAKGMSDEEMQALARQFNLSETTFVLPPENPAHTARVRIFTPAAEMPFAGHPNVGTAFVLAQRVGGGRGEMTFEEIAGIVTVRLQHGTDGSVTGARITAPHSLQIGIEIAAATVAACAGLAETDIEEQAHTPLVASVGTPFVIAEVVSPEALARAQPDLSAFRAAEAQYGEAAPRFHLLLYTWLPDRPTALRARMFAPLGGVLEDPATGSANATLAALLTSMAPGEEVELAYDIEQGVEMGRPSRLRATGTKLAEGGVFATVAGDCMPVMRGHLDL
jgi:trans-2,3-dihydro-3-hydroxyanthranilate isomerase